MQPIHIPSQLEKLIAETPIVLVYFMGSTCAVCYAIEGHLERLLVDFPLVAAAEIQAEEHKALAAQYGVFAVPTTLLFIQGKESLRFGRHLDFAAFYQQLSRYYQLIYL